MMAALNTAFHSIGRRSDYSFEQRFARLNRALSRSIWFISVARDLNLSVLHWIDLPWHCYQLKKLTSLLLNQALPVTEEKAVSELLARCCARIEFGVNVNSNWYRRLREIVDDHQISCRELRSLLLNSTIWWGTSATPSPNSNVIIRLFSNLRLMGRPPAGELLVQQHHWVTKTLTLMALCFSGAAFGAYGLELLNHVLAYGVLRNELAELVTMTMFYGTGLWICWSMGPRSWIAALRLKRLLNTTGTRANPFISDSQ